MTRVPDGTVQCPGCGLRLRADDVWGQVAHMEAEHPEIIAGRLRDAGLLTEPDASGVRVHPDTGPPLSG